MNNNLKGKKISILGDSVSTYTDYSNNIKYNTTIGNNSVYYNNYKEDRHPVHMSLTLEDTWWMQVIEELDLQLCVNNSWSGSRIYDYDVSKWKKDAEGLDGKDKAGPSSDEKGTCIFVSGGNHKASQTIVAKKGFYTVSGYVCRVSTVDSGDEATLTISTNIGSAASDSNGSNTFKFTKDEWKYFEYTFEIE